MRVSHSPKLAATPDEVYAMLTARAFREHTAAAVGAPWPAEARRGRRGER